ncbi:hypothetical protein M1146_03760 [Patescibacteria group bacterium]|nr:hypothetical protein [Patescibacteria group bacterium]
MIVIGILIFNLKNSPGIWTEDIVEVEEDREEVDNGESGEHVDEGSTERRDEDLSETVTIL